jgi:cytochrome P450
LSEAPTLAEFRACEAALRNVDLKQAMYDAGKVVMEDVLLVLHGAEHARRREVEVRVFRRNYFNHYEKEVFPRTLEQTLEPYLAAGGADLIELGYRVTANLTADFAGVDRPLKTPGESEELIRLVKKFSEGATLVHSTRDKSEVEGEVREALAAFDQRFVQPSIARREALIAAGDEEAMPRDVLTVILRARDELQLTAGQLLREIAFYMQAGAHSTANSVVHALEEIFRWAGDDAARWHRLKAPEFVQRCVHESLRLHPASPVAWRTATCPMQLAGGVDLEAGERVVLDLFAANRDPELFGPDADSFNPGRAVPAGLLPSGLAFGIGLHTCLGRELDGGVPARPGSDPATHQYGIVALVVIRLLELGARLVPGDPPTPDPRTLRPNWGRFPVKFARIQSQ